MIMTTEKMVYVKSNDYWGYDASEFDNDANFYTYTWTVPESMYNAMDSDNQAKLFPCALFYVQGVTDNHNFLTLSIDVDGANAKVRGMQGAKRRTLKFESGVEYAYSVGSLTMKAAPAGSRSVATIESEVLTGVAATDGTFNVSSFLTDAADIASAVGLATASAAESYASEMEVSDFYPQSSAEIGSEQSGRGVPVAYGSGSSQYVEPPVVELEAEVSDFYPQSSAEIGDEQSGRGVPVSYGSGSSQYVEPPVVELSAEVSDFYPQSSAEIGDEQSGRGVPVSYGSGSSQYVEPPVVELGAEVIDDNYMDVYSAQGYNDQLDESLGMRDGAERNFHQSMKDRRDESKGTEKYDGSRPYAGVDTMDAQGYNDKMDESLGMRHRGRHSQSMKDRRNEAAAMDRKYGMRRKYEDVETMDAEEMIFEGLPVIPDSYGTNSALSSGQGVPVWYGSAENRQPPWSATNRRPQRKMECGECHAKGFIAGNECSTCDGAGYWMMPSPRCDTCDSDIEWTDGAECDGCEEWVCNDCLGEDYSCPKCENNDLSFHADGDVDIPIPADAGETNPMEFVELGAYDVPVIPNTVGTDSAGGSGYGVPQWYGADTFDADRMSTSLEESAPPKMGKKVGVVALIGLGLGAWMASRKN
jgi:hypothetical protein